MDKKEFHLHNGKKGVALAIRVTPRAEKNEIAEVLNDGTIRIRLASPPDKVELNMTLTEFLAELVGVKGTKIEVVAGGKGRDKLVSILDVDQEIVHQKILSQLP
jgi:uncharacterized protein (TIGR00251 family)